MRRFALFVGLLSSVAAAADAPVKRVFVLTWDGSAKWMVDALLKEKALPNLAAMIDAGASAEFSTSNFPNSTTPPGHAALFTGCYGIVNGVVAYSQPKIPIDRYDLTEFWSGFDARNLRAEPIWVSVARAGGKSLLIHAPFATPFEPYGEWKRFGLDCSNSVEHLAGYDGQLARDHVYASPKSLKRAGAWKNAPGDLGSARELTFSVGGHEFAALFFDDPADPTAGWDTVAASGSRDFQAAVILKPGKAGDVGRFSPAVMVPGKPGAGFHLRLVKLDPDGKEFALFRTGVFEPLTNIPEPALSELRQASGVFTGNGARSAYSKGEFGPTVGAGGDGSAERFYLETVRIMLRHQRGAMKWALSRRPEGLIVGYLPIPDEAAHLWAGYVEPGGPAFDADLSAKLWPMMREVVREADAVLGELRAAAGPDTVFVLSSDHGMRGYRRYFRPNVILRRAGLLSVNLRGQIDLANTKAIYHPSGHGYVCVNTTDHKGGIVRPEDRAAVLAEVKRVLAAEKDDAGKPLIEFLWDSDPEFGSLGLGLPTTGDLYISPRAGYRAIADATGAIFEEAGFGSGQHEGVGHEAPLHTLMVFAGPGIARGKNLGPVRHIDAAPTILNLLGVPPGKKMTGKVLPVR